METSSFEKIIKAYLDKKAASEPDFAVTYAKENKNIHDCCSYIISEAEKQAKTEGSGRVCAMSDEQAYSLAVHYYDEDDIVINEAAREKCKIDANQAEQKTVEEKKGAKRKKKAESKPEYVSIKLF